MRNHLVHRLFEHHGYPAPETRHVSLFLNDRYVGVYLQTERVDEDFLERHGREMGSLYKLDFHAGVLAPALFADAYPKGWEVRGSTTPDTRPVQQLIRQIAFWNADDFARRVDELFDLDSVLFYYAAQIAVINNDGFTQNHYVYRNPDRATRLPRAMPRAGSLPHLLPGGRERTRRLGLWTQRRRRARPSRRRPRHARR